ncbi:MAG: formyltetrahydrofolate deformylase [bacterium]
MDPLDSPRSILVLSCPDTTGIVAAVTNFLASNHATLVEASHFNDETTRRSFLRTVFHDDGRGMGTLAKLQTLFEPIARQFSMDWQFYPEQRPLKTMIAVTGAGHCLTSLLQRWSVGSLPLDIVGIVSNRDTLRNHADWHNIPFAHLPIEPGREAEQEHELLQRFEQSGAELLVLARYMRVLSPELCARLKGRCINIHHSFLPGFKGARPYHQAFDRGVKLIGATAHYVTAELDEGPIIEQSVERVDHTYSPSDLVNHGRDLESSVLNRAVLWHAQHRVFLNGHKTVILK